MNGLKLTHPDILDWGHAPFAVKHMLNGRVVFYPNGMKLKITVPDGAGNTVEVYECVRVRNAAPEHQFALANGERQTQWCKDRNKAFSQLMLKCKERVVILGASDETIQATIKDRFHSEHKPQTKQKTVSWGDENRTAVSSAYGGWGLHKFKTIPNKEQIKKLEAERLNEELQARLEQELDVEMSGFAQQAQETSDCEYSGLGKENQPFLVQECSSPDSVDFLSDYDYPSPQLEKNEFFECNAQTSNELHRKRSADGVSFSCNKRLNVDDEFFGSISSNER